MELWKAIRPSLVWGGLLLIIISGLTWWAANWNINWVAITLFVAGVIAVGSALLSCWLERKDIYNPD